MLAVRWAHDCPVVTASGEFDMANAATLRCWLTGVIDSGAQHLLLDLADVTFIDAATLGVLVGARNRLAELEGDLILLRVPALIMRLLRVTDLDKGFTIQATQAEALTALGRTSRPTDRPGCSDAP